MRRYHRTDMASPLLSRLGENVTWRDDYGQVSTALLLNVTTDGMATVGADGIVHDVIPVGWVQ